MLIINNRFCYFDNKNFKFLKPKKPNNLSHSIVLNFVFLFIYTNLSFWRQNFARYVLKTNMF